MILFLPDEQVAPHPAVELEKIAALERYKCSDRWKCLKALALDSAVMVKIMCLGLLGDPARIM
jgi:hypothetical protein